MNSKKSVVLIILIIIIISVTIYLKNNTSQIKNSQSVVENYFNSMNENNVDKHLKTLSEREKKNLGKFNFDYIDYINIIKIDEEKDPKFKEGYLLYGSGKESGISKKNLKVYRVKFNVKYKKDAITSQDSGTYIKWYWVIKQNDNSSWVIDDTGYQ